MHVATNKLEQAQAGGGHQTNLLHARGCAGCMREGVQAAPCPNTAALLAHNSKRAFTPLEVHDPSSGHPYRHIRVAPIHICMARTQAAPALNNAPMLNPPSNHSTPTPPLAEHRKGLGQPPAGESLLSLRAQPSTSATLAPLDNTLAMVNRRPKWLPDARLPACLPPR